MNTGTQRYRNTDTQSERQEGRNTETKEHNFTGTEEHRNTETQGQDQTQHLSHYSHLACPAHEHGYRRGERSGISTATCCAHKAFLT